MDQYLIVFGLFWMSVNCMTAMLRLGLRHEAHVDLLKRLMKEKKYEEFEEHRSSWQWQKAVHGHSMLFSIIAIVAGLLVPMMAGSSSIYINIMGGCFIAAPILWTFFGTWFFKPLLALGDILFSAGIVMAFLALAKHLF